jgi:hypothetical protein
MPPPPDFVEANTTQSGVLDGCARHRTADPRASLSGGIAQIERPDHQNHLHPSVMPVERLIDSGATEVRRR